MFTELRFESRLKKLENHCYQGKQNNTALGDLQEAQNIQKAARNTSQKAMAMH